MGLVVDKQTNYIINNYVALILGDEKYGVCNVEERIPLCIITPSSLVTYMYFCLFSLYNTYVNFREFVGAHHKFPVGAHHFLYKAFFNLL